MQSSDLANEIPSESDTKCQHVSATVTNNGDSQWKRDVLNVIQNSKSTREVSLTK